MSEEDQGVRVEWCSVCHLEKCFSHPSSGISSLATPPIKLKLEQQIGGRVTKANHLG